MLNKNEKSENLQQSSRMQHDLYIQEIEGIDDYWGPTFRVVYDNEEYVEFKEKLEERIKHHDRDIERLCNIYYQGFIDSIRELLEVRSQAKKLNNEVVAVDKQLKTAAENITKSGSELLNARKVENNIATVISQLNLCLPVLATYSKLKKQISEKRYYPALKTLEELEHTHLPHVANYRFSAQLKENIPKIRENIEKASMSDLKDFLENIRRYSPRIGEVAMRHTDEQLANDPTLFGRKKKRPAPQPPGSGLSSEEDLSAQEMIDFSPIYRCLHISAVLGSRSTFETYYRAERTKQARLVLQPPTNMHESLESYRFYIHAVLGFFILEDHVLNTGNGLITRAFLDEMWTMALSKIVSALQTHSAYCTDATLILNIKDLIMLFSTTLRNYGYTVKPLWELVRELRDHYTEVLMQRWVQVFREILSKESFQPIKVENQEQYDTVLLSFPWDADLPDDITFPYNFPFSSMVPKVYQQVKEFIYACLKFSEDLNLSQVEVDEMIRKSMNLLLTRSFSGCLSSTFRSPHVNLQEIIQIIIDTGYLEEATVYLDQFISNITGEETQGVTTGIVQGQPAMFRVAREDAVKQICEKLRQKLNEFLELESYDWLLVEPQGHASSFISDMIAFLQTTFHSFTNLPAEVAQLACKSACEHIANSMLEVLLNDEIKQMSMGALNQINLDLLQCELFAASEPVKGLPQDVLLAYFTKLRELLDLVTSWDWPTYFHDYGKETNKYKQVSPDVAIIILEKLREGDKKTMFAVLKKSERDKKKLLETVLKQLRQLSQIPGKN
ncbi:exocyst complex component 6 isoform X2 [Agrilus planipennis]|uniref:Exocyst complex component n=1 Tax=Agrilus planipennis TaxID=224129 RepID=A0A1W4X769_AGRPL|nr:exocyst complex component 6 isoform X1 [Agrilus planipennis]XP_025837691.1 exocyst complex component 6 isoform X2 [Agrilus planipennis]